MIKKIVATIIPIVLTLSAWGQISTISGYVKEKVSREPLSGVTIRSETENRGTVTNNAGFFSLKLPSGSHRLSFSFIGYRPVTIKLTQLSDTTITVNMEEQSEAIGEVVITASDKPFSVSERGIVGVNIKQVRIAPAFLGESDIIKYMQMLPGVSSGREGSSQLVIRGSGGDQSLIMLDDMPVYNQNHSFGLISIFNSDALSGAELYKGYIPEKYGGRISAVASMRMRDGNRNEHHQSLSLGTLTLGALAEGPIKKGKGSYIVTARRFTPDLLLRGIYLIKKDSPTQLLYSFYDINGKANYDIGKRSKLSFSIYNGRDSFSNINNDYEEGEKVANAESGFKWGNLSASLKLENNPGKSIFLSNSVYYSALSNNTRLIYNNVTGADKSTGTTKSNLSELGYRTNLQLSAGERHTLNIGANLSLLTFDPYVTTRNRNGSLLKKSTPINDVYIASMYVGDNLAFGDLTLGLGIRASLYRKNATNSFSLEPRVVADYKIGNSNSAFISYSRTTQPLSSYSKNYLTFPLDFWIPYDGNKVASSDQLTAGWKSNTLKRVTLSMEVYYKTFSNLLYVVTPEDYLTGESAVYPSSGHAYGIEMLGNYSHNRLSATLSYTYSRSLRKANGNTFPFLYDIPHNLNAYATYTTLNDGTRTQKLSLNMAWHSGLPFRRSEGTYIVNGTEIEDLPIYPNTRIKPYFRTDISYSFEKKLDRGRRVWQFSILNLTGHTNPYLIYKENNRYKYSTLIPVLPSFSYIRYW